MKIRRIAGALGAEISGLDLGQDLTPQLIADVRGLWLEHQVLFFLDQQLDAGHYLRFAQAMGQPVEYPFVKGLDESPLIIEVKKLEHERINFGGIWHADTTYLPQPPMASLLLARELPPFGGDTLFANQYMAWDELSDTFKTMLTPLKGISSSAKADVSKTREDRMASDGRAQAQCELRAMHPIRRVHRETGKPALYVNVAHTAGIEGMKDEEAQPLLNYLFTHQVRPEFTCRFQWRPGALALWDNRCVQHNPVNDYHGYRRIMHRITLAGDDPI
jgi:taurine dioxygenase